MGEAGDRGDFTQILAVDRGLDDERKTGLVQYFRSLDGVGPGADDFSKTVVSFRMERVEGEGEALDPRRADFFNQILRDPDPVGPDDRPKPQVHGVTGDFENIGAEKRFAAGQ